MILLVDFDGDNQRLQDVKAKIPARLMERVFILGVLSEPEYLKRALGSYESIGLLLGQDCSSATRTTLHHDLVKHNSDELERLCGHAGEILFQPG